jgi:probable phosphoglycerate mutase
MALTHDSHQLFLVRHGRTALNAEGRLRGLADPPLDETGIAEAHAVAGALRARGIGVVYCSPLQRATHTARVIAEACGVEWITDDRFNDRDYGPWTGHLRQEVIAEFGSVDSAPGVEPTANVLERVRPAVGRVIDEHPDAAVAIVTHDAVIRPLVAALDPWAGELTVPTGSWSELAETDDVWTLLRADQKP